MKLFKIILLILLIPVLIVIFIIGLILYYFTRNTNTTDFVFDVVEYLNPPA